MTSGFSLTLGWETGSGLRSDFPTLFCVQACQTAPGAGALGEVGLAAPGRQETGGANREDDRPSLTADLLRSRSL